MRNWSHGLMFAALLSVTLVVSLLLASCESDIDVDVDHPKVHSTKTVSVKPGGTGKKGGVKIPTAPRAKKRK